MSKTLEKSLHELEAYLDGDKNIKIETHCFINMPEFTPERIKNIRSSIPATQFVFAAMLNVSPRTVSSWESGKSNPTGSAKRLLQLLDEDPKALHSVIDF
ncbi:hypothetical protein AYR62_01025 [Secundilactobacillus paracollinoides]|uniref:HTH cro/C1-type domain-containing protein n=1 Tax=Secundilactobacillus paracollinoides TaxID=240427 RepID=A0A1B2IVH0_9LACO|nr:helix-turn-helix domain-containing protein [Secundilactobacillus paracollinoides]ANZ60224.1 hypothetical protein AYR61_01895 [Secundilactobacillus paracollinoides]ANZ62821.1 hypothetical protein AYR62_01025 [Secundilactobacillus paracollinoides]ANZ66019.1 hypothetical protein AYR63_01915 [Secundilactobacillus paracollinoides]